MLKTLALWVLCATATPIAALELHGDFTQGGLVRGKVDPGSKVRLGDRALRVSPEGWFLIGFGRDAKPAILRVTRPDGGVVRRDLEVQSREYAVQRIDGLPPSKVTPSAEDMARIRRENAMIGRARRRDEAGLDFLGEFDWPVKGPVSGVFGSQRILNGIPKRPHYGVDIAAPDGTPVRAPASGVVSLVHPDMYFTGGTIMLDHGHGLSSLYIHLSKISVTEEQYVRRGEIIGAVGATGRATGPHLHWGMNWFNERIDPQLLVRDKPNQD